MNKKFEEYTVIALNLNDVECKIKVVAPSAEIAKAMIIKKNKYLRPISAAPSAK
jgi:hypothetical protein